MYLKAVLILDRGRARNKGLSGGLFGVLAYQNRKFFLAIERLSMHKLFKAPAPRYSVSSRQQPRSCDEIILCSASTVRFSLQHLESTLGNPT